MFAALLLVIALLLQSVIAPIQPVSAQKPAVPAGNTPAPEVQQTKQNPLPPTLPLPPAGIAALIAPAVDTVPPSVTPDSYEKTLKSGESDTFQVKVFTGSTPIGKADIMFAFDLTGSMGGELSQVKASALEIANAIRAELPNSWFGVSSFMDYAGTFSYPGYADTYGSSSYGDVPWKLNLHPTVALDAMAAEINKLTLGWGADWPEDYTRVLYELGQAEEIGWRQGAKKIVVLFGDAPTHDLDFAGYNFGGDPGRDNTAQTDDDLDFETVVQQLADQQITVIAIDSGYDEYSGATMQGMSVGYAGAVGTKGQYYQLSDTGDIPQLIVDSVLGEAQTIDVLSLQVTSGYENWVTIDPPSKENVPAMVTETFTVTVKPPDGTGPGYYPFVIRTMADGAIIGKTAVYVMIEAKDKITDLGFKPKPDGFGSANFTAAPDWQLFTQMFGRSQVEYDDGTRINAADRFFQTRYSKEGGLCHGFSGLSLINYKHLAQPNWGTYSLAYHKDLFSDSDSASELAGIRNSLIYAARTWYNAEMDAHIAYSCENFGTSPRLYYNYLKSLLQNGAPAVLSIWWAWDPKKPLKDENVAAHSITPYRFEEPDEKTAYVYVYENNAPESKDYRLRFDLEKDELRYEDTNILWPDRVVVSWDQIKVMMCPQILVTPFDLYLHPGVPNWEVPGSAAAASASVAGLPGFQAYMVSGKALLLFEDDSGQRFGWNGSESLNEIPGAAYYTDPEVTDSSVHYTLPDSSTYKAWVVGTGVGQANVATWFGSTFVEIGEIAVVTNTVLALNFADDGSVVGISGANAGTNASISINHVLADQDRTVTVKDVQVQPGQSVQMTYTLAPAGSGAAGVGTADAAADQITLSSSGGAADAYNLSLHRAGTGGYVAYASPDIPLQTDTTHVFTVAEWSALDTITIAADVGQDGIPDAPIVAPNSAVAAALEVSAPNEVTAGSVADVTIGVRDQFGAYVANGTQVDASATSGSLSAAGGATIGGLVHLRLTAPNQIGTVTLRAAAGGVAGERVVTVTPAAAAAINLQAAPQTLPADGSSTTQVSARVVDQFANPIANEKVEFTTTLGTITEVAVTAADGWAQATLTSTLQVGTAQVTAQSGSLTQTIDIPLAGAPIRGLVFADLNGNGSQDSDEPGLSGIEIALRNDLSGAVVTTKTATDGRFAFAALPLTNYTLTIAALPGLRWGGTTTIAIRLGIDGAEAPAVGGSYNIFLPLTQR